MINSWQQYLKLDSISKTFLGLGITCFGFTNNSLANNIGCSTYSPSSGNSVVCDTTYITGNRGIISVNSAIDGNGVSVILADGVLSAFGEGISLGSGATIRNAASLDTVITVNSNGINLGQGARSQMGGNTVINDGNGVISAGGSNSSGIAISSMDSSAQGNLVENYGTISNFSFGGSYSRAGIQLSTASNVADSTIFNDGYGVIQSASNAIYVKNTGTKTVNVNNNGYLLDYVSLRAGIAVEGGGNVIINNNGVIGQGVGTGILMSNNLGLVQQAQINNSYQIFGDYNAINASEMQGLITNNVGGEIVARVSDNAGGVVATINSQSIGSGRVSISNNGTIQGQNTGTAGGINNAAYGVLISDGSGSIGSDSSLVNNGAISALSNGYSYGIYFSKNNDGSKNELINSSTIASIGSATSIGNYQSAVAVYYKNSNFINQGTISANGFNATGVLVKNDSSNNFLNNGTINAAGLGSNFSVTNQANSIIGNFLNDISGTLNGHIKNDGFISKLTNSGTINGDIINSGQMGVLELNSPIVGVIRNSGSISTLKNISGSSISYDGALPNSYSVKFNSPTDYGKLVVTNASGSLSFSILSGSNLTNKTKYSSVFSGVSLSNITNASGLYSGKKWTFLQDGSNIDLYFGGDDPAPAPIDLDTQKSIDITANSLRPVLALQNAVLINSLSYDCSNFGEGGSCVSVGARTTSANGKSNSAGMVTISHKLLDTLRVGLFVDQNISQSNTNSIINVSNGTPTAGGFLVANQNSDLSGLEGRISFAYGSKNTQITRPVIGISEAGSGSSSLTSYGVQGVAIYNYSFDDDVVSPYAGLRYSQQSLGGYSESLSQEVSNPLSYSSINTSAVTLISGISASIKVNDVTSILGSAGIENDIKLTNGSLSTAGYSSVAVNPNYTSTRLTASLGASYAFDKNQRVILAGTYRQESYKQASSRAVFASYMIGF